MSMRQSNIQFKKDNFFGFQVDWPVFVKIPFHSFGKYWKKGEEFNWRDQKYRAEDEWKIQQAVFNLYKAGNIAHDTAKEKENKVGDRLNELNAEQLYRLVSQLNSIVKERTSSATEFKDKKCKSSKIQDKQRGLIRQFLRRSTWITEDFYRIRDTILGE